MSEATVSQEAIVNLCIRLSKAQACSKEELKGHSNALRNLAKMFKFQYELALKANNSEGIKVLRGQVMKEPGEIFVDIYKDFEEAVGLRSPKPVTTVLAPKSQLTLEDIKAEIESLKQGLEAIMAVLAEERKPKAEKKAKAGKTAKADKKAKAEVVTFADIVF